MDIIRLEYLDIYQLACEIGEVVWNTVGHWPTFPKTTIGTQFVDAADSISANIAEGYGRYFYKDRRQFCYYSRGSLMETKNWVTKSFRRSLLDKAEYDDLIEKPQTLHYKLNAYVKKLRANSNSKK